jgi:ankyrin repeat protein
MFFAEMISDADSQEMRRLGASFLHRMGGRTLEDASIESRMGGVVQKNSPKSVGALFVRLKALEILGKHMSNIVAGKGDPENVRSLILKRGDISARNRYHGTALHIAAASGHEDCIYKLFELKADIVSKDTLQRTALHHAAMKGRAASVIALIKLRADINATDKYGFSPLDLTTDSDCTRLLKQIGACGWTQLMVAVESGDSSSEKYFKVRESVLCMQMRYPFPLWFQIELRDKIPNGVSSEDSQLGIDNLQWTEEDDRLVHDLPSDGDCHVLSVFRYERNTQVKYSHCFHALNNVFACLFTGESRDLEDHLRRQRDGLLSTKSVGSVIVRTRALSLLDRLLKQLIGEDESDGADASTKCQVFERGESVMRVLGLALDESMADKQKRNTLQLIISGSDINAVNKDLQTALHVAAERGHMLSVQTLLELNADVDSRDSMQRSALHYAAHQGHTKVVKALLDFKASVNVTDVDNLTPLDLTRLKSCAESLRKCGAKEQLRFSRGDEVQLSEYYMKCLDKDSAIKSLERKGVLLDIEGDKGSDDEEDYEDPSYQVSFMERPLKRGDIVFLKAQQ